MHGRTTGTVYDRDTGKMCAIGHALVGFGVIPTGHINSTPMFELANLAHGGSDKSRFAADVMVVDLFEWNDSFACDHLDDDVYCEEIISRIEGV